MKRGMGIDTSEEYFVEKIVGKRFQPNGKVEYFVKWKDWPSYTNTWEPVEHIQHCNELIEEYEHKKQMKAGNGRKLPNKSQTFVLDTQENQNPNTNDTTKYFNENMMKPKNDESAEYVDYDCCTDLPDVAFVLPKVNGFERGLKPQRIVGATDSGGLTFLMKWENSNNLELVRSHVARQYCPQLVIQFYERHITWHRNQQPPSLLQQQQQQQQQNV